MKFIPGFKTLADLIKSPKVRSIGIYTATNFITKSTSFLLLFIFTNPLYITPSENGLLSLVNTSILLLMPFIYLGILHSTGVDYFKLNKEEFRNSFTTGFFLAACTSVIVLILVFLFREPLSRQFGLTQDVLLLIPVITFLGFCIEQALTMARNTHDPGAFFRTNMTRTILELCLSVMLVVFFAWRWQGRIAGILAANLVVAIMAFRYFLKKDFLFGYIKRIYIREELLYALPVIILQLSRFAMYSSDKFFLSEFVRDNNETVGIYSIASTFGSVILTFNFALIAYFSPRIYSELATSKPDYSFINRQFWLFFLLMLIATVIMILFTIPVYYFFINPLYHSALKYFYLLNLGYFFCSISSFLFIFILFEKRKKSIFYIAIFNLLLSLTLNYILIPHWKGFGAALAVCISFAASLLLTLLFTRKQNSGFLRRH